MRFPHALLALLTAVRHAAVGAVSAVAAAAGSAVSSVLGGFGRALGTVGRGASTAGRGALALLPGEWRKPIAALFVVGLALVPVIYSGTMTWSFRDPSHSLEQITAAVVDEDEGATTTTSDGEQTQLDVGAEFTDTLLEMDKETVFHFVEVSPAEAQRGLEDGTYGASIAIPADFSAHVASLGGEAEQAAPALLTVTTNDSVNYVGGNFTKSVGIALTDALRASVLEEYLGNIYLGFTTIHDGVAEAADGADELSGGAADLHDGTGELVAGSRTLADGTGELATGAEELSTGATTLLEGELDLVVGLDQLSTGADTLEQGAQEVNSGAGRLSRGLVALDENGRPLRSGARSLADGTTQLATGASALAGGAGQVADGTQQLDDTVGTAWQRVQELGVDEQSVQRTSEDLITALTALEGAATDLPGRLRDPVTDAGTLSEAATTVDDTANGIDESAQTLASSTEDRTTDARTLQDGAATIGQDATALDTEVQDTAQATSTAAESATTSEQSTREYTEAVDDLATRCADSGADAAFCEELTGISDTSSAVREDASTSMQDIGEADRAGSIAAETSSTFAGAASGMTEAADSLVPYLEGLSTTTSTLAEDSTTLADATGPLAEDAASLDQGLTSLREDAVAAAPSPEQEPVASQLAGDLTEQARTAAAALPEAYSVLEQGAEEVHRLNTGAREVSSGADRLAAASGTASTGAEDLADGVTRYTDGASTARSGAEQLSSGTEELAGGASQLADGATEAESGAQRLAEGAGELETGARTLADGAGRADQGAEDLAEGAVTLDDGAGQLADGSSELRDGLVEAEQEVPSYSDAEGEQLSEVAADPVQMSFERAHGLDRFGEGLTPLFLSISLWVGAMAIFLMMPPFSESAATRGTGALGLLAGGLVPALLLGLVQTAIAVGALRLAIGIEMVDLPLALGIAALTSAVFVALNHGFGALFGPVGKFVALVLIALQISGAGGTYPTQTLPEFFQVIHPYLPMTHAVDALRGAIGGGWIDPVGDLQWLGGWLILGVALGLAGALVRHRRALGEVAAA